MIAIAFGPLEFEGDDIHPHVKFRGNILRLDAGNDHVKVFGQGGAGFAAETAAD